uniref:RNA-directed DNA polymerase from mobile element jockey n=1 Tax=Bactrocera latifrons TaxID=174628 RepID=A0A0K8U6S8_BACLA
MITLLQWNINGYVNNYINLELLMGSHNPSIILLNETHLSYNASAFTPRAYVGYFINLPHNTTNKQGVAILVKRNLPHVLLPIPLSIFSSVAIEILAPYKISIICAYSPPDQSFSTTEFLNLIPSGSNPFILCGDFNAWSPLWGSASANSKGRSIEDALLRSNCIVLNDGSPTHFSTHSTFTNIDLSICSASLSSKISWCCIDDLHGSDHFPILSKISTSRPHSFFKPRIRFKTDSADWDRFVEACFSHSRYFPFSSNINQEASRIQKIIRSASNYSFPLSSSKPVKLAPLWWNNELSALRNLKQIAWHQFKRLRSSANLIAYKKSNALFRHKAKAAKVHCFQEFTNNITSSSDSRKIWTDIKRLAGLSPSSPITYLNTPRGTLLYPKDIALEFATHFSNISLDSNFSSDFSSSKLSSLCSPYLPPSTLSQSAEYLDADISELDFNLALSSVKGKTPGIDKISYLIIKHLPPFLISRLVKLYNSIFLSGNYPVLWKTSAIIPILKPGKPPGVVSSYRPISLLPCLGKLIEKIIATRLAWYAQSNNLISHNQVAFKRGQGTLDALLHLDHFISDALSHKNHVSILSLDFLKAFDRIGIHVVLRQLSRWRVGSRIFNFVKSFLSNRKLSVIISNVSSSVLPLDNGTPQGSPLSVILFTIAFDEISTILSDFVTIRHQIYADDLILFSKTSNLTSVTITFSEILLRLSRWSSTSGTSISFPKSKLFHICKKHQCTIPTLTFDNTNILCTDSIKFLGIVLDSKYTFKKHCQYIRKRLFVNLNIIKYLSCKRSLIGSALLVNVTKALISSVINYGLEIYGHHSKNHLKMLAAPYHSSVRCSLRVFPTSPIKNILTEAGLPSLKDAVEDSLNKLYSKLILSTNFTIKKDFQSSLCRKRSPKIPSSIFKSALFAKTNELPLKILLPWSKYIPPWKVNESSFISDLTFLRKSITPSTVYKSRFLELSAHFKSFGWQFIYTDGSKSSHTSFAVVDDNQQRISYGLLFPFCSIFTAEATGILKAVQYAQQNLGKFIICTDSLSCFQALKNRSNYNDVIIGIRSLLFSLAHRLKIMWIPGHSGIIGNTFADSVAKEVCITPTTTSALFVKSDIKRLIIQQRSTKLALDWMNYRHHYSRINSNRIKPSFPSSLSSNYIIPYIRLRIGHSIITHAHILNGTQINQCPFCDSDLNLLHLLQHCPALQTHRLSNFNNTDPIILLMDPSSNNISKIYNFLKDSDLLRRI